MAQCSKFFVVFFSLLGFLIFLLRLGFQNLPSGELEVTLLDVGQGDAILIRTPQNQKILVDAGPVAKVLLPLGRELNYLERDLDLVVLTHPDADHIAGLTEVLRRYKVGAILLTGVYHDTVWYADILEQIQQREIPVLIANEKVDFDFGAGVMLDTIWPREVVAGKKPQNANQLSIVLRLTFGPTAVLLTGDLDQASEKVLLQTPQNLRAQILKLGHHGSKTSSRADFLAAVGSDVALVSAGPDNRFGHPAPEVLERVKEQVVLNTAEEGSIQFRSDSRVWRRVDLSR